MPSDVVSDDSIQDEVKNYNRQGNNLGKMTNTCVGEFLQKKIPSTKVHQTSNSAFECVNDVVVVGRDPGTIDNDCQ